MQGKKLFEYAVIRVLPKVEREEFINVGIILFSKKAKYIHMKYKLKMSEEEVLKKAAEMVAYAKKYCEDVERDRTRKAFN